MSVSTNIFLFPHQDDEFGVYYALSKEINKGRDIWCVYLTDGGSKAKQRNEESLRVLKKIGVKGEQVLFQGEILGIKDGTLVNNLKLAANWFLLFVQSLGEIERIYVPAWEGGHPDHDALHALTIVTANCIGLLDRVRQFSLYNGFQRRTPFFRVMFPLDSNGQVEQNKISMIERLKFIRMCLSYPSQVITWIGLFPFVACSYLFIGKQYLQKVSLERLSNRPHEGGLYYESRGFDTWDNMHFLIDDFLASEECLSCKKICQTIKQIL